MGYYFVCSHSTIYYCSESEVSGKWTQMEIFIQLLSAAENSSCESLNKAFRMTLWKQRLSIVERKSRNFNFENKELLVIIAEEC